MSVKDGIKNINSCHKEIKIPLIKRFEDIQAWQEARILTRQIYELSEKGPFAKTKALIGGFKHSLTKSSKRKT